MSETRVRIRVGRPRQFHLPPLTAVQSAVVEEATRGHVVVRGAPGSGRTTCALAVLGAAAKAGESVMLLCPDRTRANHLLTAAQALAGDQVRPVRTPAALAYHVVDTWRNVRTDPLGPVELVTGAWQDQLLSRLLDRLTLSWPAHIGDSVSALPVFRMELRNLFSRAGEAGVDPKALAHFGVILGVPEWEVAAEVLAHWEGDPGFDVETRGTMRADLARIQHLAAGLIDGWQGTQEVSLERAPVPDVLVVDDLQDCTASTVELLAAAARAGTRVVALSDPDVMTASYRGGEPHLDMRLAQVLGVDIRELGDVHRGTSELRALVRRVVQGISQSGPAARRSATLSGSGEATDEGGTPGVGKAVNGDEGAINVHVVASTAQLGALFARHLRSHHLHDRIAWDQQVVICKSSSQVEEMRRLLRRAGVPLGGARQAFAFSREPVSRTLLTLVAGDNAVDGEWNLEDVALDLVESPFVEVDALDLSQHLRSCPPLREEGDPGDVGRPATVRDLLEKPELRDRVADKALREALERAAAIWALREPSRLGRPREALWALWEASGRASAWREMVLRGGEDQELMDERLDVALALFRVADVWEQRHPDGSAVEFARGLLAEDVPRDTLVHTGVRSAGVEVLTPAQAMGREWEVVCIGGLQDGSWPDLRLRNRLLRADLLGDLVSDRLPLDDAGRPVKVENPRAARKALLDDEMRLWAAALSRARRHLHLGTVSAKEEAPSPFLDAVVPLAVNVADEDLSLEEVPPPLDLGGHVASLRHLAAGVEDGPERQEATLLLALLRREGVPQADPRRWTGAGGVSSAEAVVAPGQVTVSPSSFESARQCPLKWFLSRHGADPQGGDEQKLGTLVHSIAEHHPHGPREALLEELDERRTELDVDTGTGAGRQRWEHARLVVEALAEHIESVPGRVEVEVRLDVEIAGVRIQGRIDRVEHVDGGVRVVDLKTGKGGNKKQPKDASDNPQLALYQLGLMAQGHEVLGGFLKFFGNEDVRTSKQPPLDEAAQDEWRAELRRVAALMEGPEYPATPSEEACRYCPHTRTCPAKETGVRSVE